MTAPRSAPPMAADEATTLVAFLDHFRATLRRQAEGLDAEQLATPLPPGTLTLGGLVKHLAYVEDYWFRHVLAGGDPAEPWASVDWASDPDWDFGSAVDDTPEELRALHGAAVVAADAEIRRCLDQGGPDVLAARDRHGSRPTLRWILVHMIEEYARHCGHADLIRESLDGAVDL